MKQITQKQCEITFYSDGNFLISKIFAASKISEHEKFIKSIIDCRNNHVKFVNLVDIAKLEYKKKYTSWRKKREYDNKIDILKLQRSEILKLNGIKEDQPLPKLTYQFNLLN